MSLSTQKAKSCVSAHIRTLPGRYLYLNGCVVATGRSPCVGLVGLTLGGGIGTLQGKHGLVMDSLLSVRMVTAQGNIVKASREENSELFWGPRDAGANFGVVTSATYRTYPATNGGHFVNADFEFAAKSSSGLWELLKSLDDDEKMPAELSIVIGAGYNRVNKEVSCLRPSSLPWLSSLRQSDVGDDAQKPLVCPKLTPRRQSSSRMPPIREL